MRSIKLQVGNKEIGSALTWAYPYGEAYGYYKIPTYELTVSGKNDSGFLQQKKFEVLRFGVKGPKGDKPRVVGLADQQSHIIKAWLPHYTVHSAASLERGAWQVYDNFLIHDGPDDPKREAYASVGCVEVCNGPQGFDMFNDFIILLSGAKAVNRDAKLREIGQSKNMTITYLKAMRPRIARP